MVYNRYQIDESLIMEEKKNIMRNYLSFYERLYASEGETALNKKINRSIFNEVLDEIGNVLQKKAREMSYENNEIKSFLEKNPLPEDMEKHLPIEFRVFALLLNALKQWVSKESRYTDQYLLGGKAREICRSSINECMITGEQLGKDSELHHPIRDGRPPILLSKKGHETIERYYQRNLVPDSELNESERNHLKKRKQLNLR
jgi:hypothetical protein